MSASLSLQKALRAALTSSPELLALVPAENVVDRHGPPQAFPSIIMGADVEVASDLTFDRHHVDLTLTLHVWTKEPGTIGAKTIAYAIRRAVERPLELDQHRLIDMHFASARFLRDPDNETTHGVVTLEATVEESI